MLACRHLFGPGVYDDGLERRAEFGHRNPSGIGCREV
jgi:hypothetical protein